LLRPASASELAVCADLLVGGVPLVRAREDDHGAEHDRQHEEDQQRQDERLPALVGESPVGIRRDHGVAAEFRAITVSLRV
jgi:hypothetical protein